MNALLIVATGRLVERRGACGFSQGRVRRLRMKAHRTVPPALAVSTWMTLMMRHSSLEVTWLPPPPPLVSGAVMAVAQTLHAHHLAQLRGWLMATARSDA
jgi:hypothetical protein